MARAEYELEVREGAGRAGVVDVGELTVRVVLNHAVCLIQLFGELDLRLAPRVEHEIREAEANDQKMVILDLRGLEFIDSSGIAMVVHAVGRAREDGVRFGLLRGTDRVDHTFEIAGLNGLLPFVD